MSRLRIEHSTIYTYRRPVSFGRHRMVLRPREGHDSRVESMSLRIAPAHRLHWSRDIYSNSVAIVDFLEEADRLEVHSDVIVDRFLPFPTQEDLDHWRVPLPVDYDSLEKPVVDSYQLASYQDDLPAIVRWLAQHPGLSESGDAESMLLKLCLLIHQSIKYQRRPVKGVQTPAETLGYSSGSCRDMATLMMDAARSMGLAARFASGYLDCPAAEAGRAAMHAWAEIYLPVLGWRGFDPTLGESCSLKHIAVGLSHHPRGVMPISGRFNGESGDFIEMKAPVKLERL